MNKLIRITKKFMLGLIIIAVCLFTFIASPTSPLKNQTNKVVLNADTWNSKLAEIENIQTNILTKYISIKELLTLDSEDLVLSASDPSSIDENTVIMLNDGLDVYYFSEVCNPTFANGKENPYYKTYLTLNYTLGADIDYEDASKADGKNHLMAYLMRVDIQFQIFSLDLLKTLLKFKTIIRI